MVRDVGCKFTHSTPASTAVPARNAARLGRTRRPQGRRLERSSDSPGVTASPPSFQCHKYLTVLRGESHVRRGASRHKVRRRKPRLISLTSQFAGLLFVVMAVFFAMHPRTARAQAGTFCPSSGEVNLVYHLVAYSGIGVETEEYGLLDQQYSYAAIGSDGSQIWGHFQISVASCVKGRFGYEYQVHDAGVDGYSFGGMTSNGGGNAGGSGFRGNDRACAGWCDQFPQRGVSVRASPLPIF